MCNNKGIVRRNYASTVAVLNTRLHIVPHSGVKVPQSTPDREPSPLWSNTVSSFSPQFCQFRLCTQGMCLPLQHSVIVASTTIESPETQVLVKISPEYEQFCEVFSKTKASGLPSLRIYDCAIKLVAGATPPHNIFTPYPQPAHQEGTV